MRKEKKLKLKLSKIVPAVRLNNSSDNSQLDILGKFRNKEIIVLTSIEKFLNI
jgi:hypothetical protein